MKRLELRTSKSLKHNTVHNLCIRVSVEHNILNCILLHCSEAKVWAPQSEY